MKTDEAAKLRQLWQQHLKDWQQSGIRQTPWCRQRGLSPHQFSYWKKKFDDQACTAKTDSCCWDVKA